MLFGTGVTSFDDVDRAVRAEVLGYDFCWAPDSELLYPDPFALLAEVARRTRTLRLGPGVAVAPLRLAPVLANQVATLNLLAPGRVFLGIGTGQTAMRMIGQRPMTAAAFRDYVSVVRGLLRGDEVAYTRNGATSAVRFQSEAVSRPEHAHIPLHVSGFGPKALAVAAELGDAAVTAFPRAGTVPDVRRRLAAAAPGRDRADLELYALMNLLVLEPGETLASERAIQQCGPSVMANVHYYVDLYREIGALPPDYVLPIWDDYLAFHATRDAARAHQQMHQSHYAYLDPEEARFMTPEIIRSFCLAGQPDEIIQRLRELEDEGLTGVMFPSPARNAVQTMEEVAGKIIARYKQG